MKIKLTDKKEVFNFCEPYIIAELGSNHNGDKELAKKLIIAAKESGADCVKFQSWSKETIFSKKVYEDNYFLKDDYRNRTDYTLERIVKEFSISEQELLDMKRFSDEVGIDCTSTPFSKREVDFLVDELQSPFIKVASMDLNNYPFLEYLAKKGLPVVLATGLSEFYEIDRAVRTIENAGNNQIVVLHCVALYPPKDEDVNLNNIESLQKIYPYPIGFSDHTFGFSVPLAAVAKGACIIEKHFTLDKNLFGWDHKISATPEELEIICGESKRIQRAMGSFRFRCEEDEERKAAFRRSIVTTRTIKAGEVIRESDIDFKRPGTGIAPAESKYVIGRKTKKDIGTDELILWKDLI
ncbi:MAG: N,N'-diacetyllegionaminic acid synthase [Candidatus Brocadia fulgida]|nr:N,N'-diacetyllegionaminic acid synthase [Candidatus Brocadia fulgida]